MTLFFTQRWFWKLLMVSFDLVNYPLKPEWNDSSLDTPQRPQRTSSSSTKGTSEIHFFFSISNPWMKRYLSFEGDWNNTMNLYMREEKMPHDENAPVIHRFAVRDCPRLSGTGLLLIILKIRTHTHTHTLRPCLQHMESALSRIFIWKVRYK